ncbi:MAG: hypothetical protein H6732_08935 [Alphaproteobacteria bacterium]|nr:hypothetical protein [Alphaproteobacteria bacterium]
MIRRSLVLGLVFAGACTTTPVNVKGGDVADDTDPDYQPGDDSADTFTFDTTVPNPGNAGGNNGTPNGGANGGNGGANNGSFPNGGFGTGLPNLGTGLPGLGTGLGTGLPGLGTGLFGTGLPTPVTGGGTPVPTVPLAPLAVPLGSQPGAVFAFP